jgi:hypothetical protein
LRPKNSPHDIDATQCRFFNNYSRLKVNREIVLNGSGKRVGRGVDAMQIHRLGIGMLSRTPGDHCNNRGHFRSDLAFGVIVLSVMRVPLQLQHPLLSLSVWRYANYSDATNW